MTQQRSQIEMRMAVLQAGERLGWPRVGYGTGRKVHAGESAWTAFAATAPLQRLAPLLRHARILADYMGVPANDAETDVIVAKTAPDTRSKRLVALAKARAAKAQRRAAAAAAQEGP